MRLLEREPHLAALGDYVLEVREGQGRLVLVSGEAGVGKSSLLEELEARTGDARWFWGACDGLFTPRPLGPLLDVAGQLDGELADLVAAQAPREQLFGALLRQLDGDAVTVLVVEDVHWADEATLDLLRFLGRRIRESRALVLVTYRDDAVAAAVPLRVALGQLSTQRTTRRLSLPPLSAAAVEELADGTGLEPGELYRLTGGNPFFLTEVVDSGLGDLPSSARDAVLARVAGVSAQARGVLDVATLVGPRLEPALLATVTGAPPSALDELVACGILVGDGDRLRFRHEIARLAVEQALPAHRRGPVHAAVLTALVSSGCDDDARLAFHAEGAGDADLVLLHAPAAARRAADLSSHQEAAAQWERAVRFADRADARTRAALYDDLAYELSLVDRWPDSAGARLQALELWRELDDRLREGASLDRLSRAMWRLCRGEEGRRANAEALAVLEPLGPTPELARTYVYAAGIRMDAGDHEGAVRLGDRAAAIAEDLELPDVLSDALNTVACARADAGADDWLPTMRRALDVAVAAGRHEQAGRAYANTYSLLCGLLRFEEAERVFAEGIAHCDEHDIATYSTCMRGQRSVFLACVGRWAEARSLAVRLLGLGASPVNRLNPLIGLGLSRARSGDEGVWEPLDEAMSLAESLDEATWLAMVGMARAEARWLEGDAVAASHEILLAQRVTGPGDAMLRSELAATLQRITGEQPPADALEQPYATLVAGEHRAAAKLWDELGCPYDAALALLDSGDEELLREALARFEDLGAAPAVRLARQRMRDLGVRSIPTGARAATREHPAGLTPREREVLELVCEGRTNDEISAELVISVRTVDHHVAAVLGKLGVPSRKVAAREAVRRGLVGARS